ncbi:MAG: tetratricopeptide repeat protein [Leptolyngbyaceae cyanobacterium CRU_2_3]|nr:tetratricopeptide repeat protein [Leptolyngbyaceae cyanobacterium CRU_2_3]
MPESLFDHTLSTCTQALKDGVNLTQSCQMLGNLLQSMGRFEEAIVWHTRALQPQPNLVETYASLGGLHAKQKNWQEAIAAYEQALSLNPGYAEAHRSLASIYAQLGEREIESTYRYQAVALNPRWATPNNQFTLGNSLLEVAKLEEAIDCYQRAIALRPGFFEVHYNLGVVYVQQEQWQPASEAFQQALALNPSHAASYFGLGKVAEAQNQTQGAIAHYRQAVALNPRWVNALYSLAETLAKLRQWQEAAALYRQVVELSPEFSWAHHNLGYTLLKLERWDEAIDSLQRAIELNVDSPWTYSHLGDALFHRQQWQAAAAAFLAAIERQPSLEVAYLRLGEVLRKQVETDFELVLQQYQQAMPLQPEHQVAEFYRLIGRQLLYHQRWDGAILFDRLALALQPNDLEGQRQLQLACSAKQQLEVEIAAYRQQIRQHPDYPWLYAQLGNLMADQGERLEAIALVRQASVLQGWQCATSRNYQFSHDWFTHNIPIWTQYLEPFAHRPHVQALEIGSFEGMSACWLLDHILTHPTAGLACIDRYFQDKFYSNVTQTGASERITQFTGESHNVLADLNSVTYDLIYIDGCHLADFVQRDAELSWRLLKLGGVMIFDDYQWTDPNHPGQDCKLGIDTFLASVANQIEFLHQGYQIMIKRVNLQ